MSRQPWWNRELGSLRRSIKELLKLTKLADEESCWREYKDIHREYKKEIRKGKMVSWKSFCVKLEKTRFSKLLSKHQTTLLRLISGEWTECSKESLIDYWWTLIFQDAQTTGLSPAKHNIVINGFEPLKPAVMDSKVHQQLWWFTWPQYTKGI